MSCLRIFTERASWGIRHSKKDRPAWAAIQGWMFPTGAGSQKRDFSILEIRSRGGYTVNRSNTTSVTGLAALLRNRVNKPRQKPRP